MFIDSLTHWYLMCICRHVHSLQTFWQIILFISCISDVFLGLCWQTHCQVMFSLDFVDRHWQVMFSMGCVDRHTDNDVFLRLCWQTHWQWCFTLVVLTDTLTTDVSLGLYWQTHWQVIFYLGCVDRHTDEWFFLGGGGCWHTFTSDVFLRLFWQTRW